MSLGSLYLLGFNLIEINLYLKTMILSLQFCLRDMIFIYLYNNFIFMMNYKKNQYIYIYDNTVDFIWGSTYYTNYYSQVFSFIIYKKKCKMVIIIFLDFFLYF